MTIYDNETGEVIANHASLVRLDEVCRTLADLKTVDEVKDIRDKAEAMRVYARQAKLGLESQNYAAEIKLRAERRAGELLRDMERVRGPENLPSLRESQPSILDRPTLADLGVSNNQSSTWQRIAALPEEQFEAVIARTKVGGEELTTAGMVREARKLEPPREPSPTPVLPNGRYNLILADPPWQYEHVVTPSRDIENQYPTMTIGAICTLPVPDLVVDDAILFLWCPASLIRQGLEVVDAWEFNYRSQFVWVKDRIGMGYFTRSRHELLFVATRGNWRAPEPPDRFDSVIEAPRGRHSEKPENVYEMIEQMYPDAVALEMFARASRAGWVAWGNEV